MDLDDEELEATRSKLGVNAKVIDTNDKLQKLQEEGEAKIKEAVDKFNEACTELSKLDIVQHIALIGYIDVGVASGFISSKYGLDHIESLTTFLLDYTSKNIKEGVKAHAEMQAKEIEKEINKIEEDKKENNEKKEQ